MLPIWKFEIVATSFDGHTDLIEKYPEWIGIEPKLRTLGVTVVHNVDATALDERVLRHRSTPLSSSDAQYHHVIFNHPHTGTEDMRRHRSFLGHFFHALVTPIEGNRSTDWSRGRNGSDERQSDSINDSSQDGDFGGSSGVNTSNEPGAIARRARLAQIAHTILAPGGIVHVTLAGDQPERWGLCEQAARHGFSLVHRRPFRAERIEGYMSKRHQTGKSFQRRARQSDTLSFVWTRGVGGAKTTGRGDRPSGVDGTGKAVGGVEAVTEMEVDERPRGTGGMYVEKNVLATDESCSREGIGHHVVSSFATSDAQSLPPWLWHDVDMFQEDSGNRRRGGAQEGKERDEGVIKHGTNAATVAVHQASPATKPDGQHDHPVVCRQCGKRYKTSQGLRTHTRQLHELCQKEGGFGASSTSELLPCAHCGREFTSHTALTQHQVAKHGTFSDIKPDWFERTIYLDAPSPQPQQQEETKASISGDGGDGDGTRDDSVPGSCTSSDESWAERENVMVTTRVMGVEGSGACEARGEECASQGGRVKEVDLARESPKEVGKIQKDQGDEKDAVTLSLIGLSSPSPATAELQDSSASTPVHCAVCGYWFSDEMKAEQHLGNLRPVNAGKVVRHECSVCDKQFGSRRALFQHVNFCGTRGDLPESASSAFEDNVNSSFATPLTKP